MKELSGLVGYGLLVGKLGNQLPQLMARLQGTLIPWLEVAAAAATLQERRVKALMESEGVDPSVQIDLGGAMVPPLGELVRRQAAAARQALRVAKAALFLLLLEQERDAWYVLLLAEHLGVGGPADSAGEGTFTLLPGAPGKQSGGHSAHRAAYLEAARVLWGDLAPAEPASSPADTAAELVMFLHAYEEDGRFRAACPDRHLAVAIRLLAEAGREDDLKVALRVWKDRWRCVAW